jgi:hypothetical protein
MLQYMKWEINQQGMADSVSIRSSKRAGSLVRKFYQVSKEEKEADPLLVLADPSKIPANSSLLKLD